MTLAHEKTPTLGEVSGLIPWRGDAIRGLSFPDSTHFTEILVNCNPIPPFWLVGHFSTFGQNGAQASRGALATRRVVRISKTCQPRP